MKKAKTTSKHKPVKPFFHDIPVYLAGDLFDFKHLVGNKLLAENIQLRSNGKYKIVLPQEVEQRKFEAIAIRNTDLRTLMFCDLAIFNFDGTDLDSGTVVEFMAAKFLDIPSVILRTDFRKAGDGVPGADPWNLMATGWPRTNVLLLNAFEMLQAAKGNFITLIGEDLPDQIIQALNMVRETEPTNNNEKMSFWSYEWLRTLMGAEPFTEEETEIMRRKREQGLVR